jgi:murein DD-endopeptidase MepM/ murein hydrolase activator NlpD
MKKVLTLIAVGLLCFSILPILSPQVKASLGTAPEVICIPFHGERLAVPHDAWIGKEIILKGTAHDKDGDGTMVAYKWDFGDGYATDWISGVNPYIIEAKHTYTGTMADGTPYGPGKYFTAWLYVKDNEDLVGKDSYFIAIRDKTLDVEVNVGLDNGLWWLHKQQIRATYGDGTEYGYWHSSYGYHVAFTAASTEAFELQGHLPSGNRGEDPYVETVQRGLNYLFNQFHTYSISQHATYCPLGNPDVNGNGIGLACFTGDISRQIYESGMALMTISSSGAPNRIAATGTADVIGRAYKDIVQDMVDFMAWAQSDPYTGVYEGGWRYYTNYGQSDNSVSQWPVIGMEAAERNFGTSGVTVPSFVRPELLKWLTYSQGGDGGFGYQAPGSWENTAKTGAGCAMLYWAGVPTSDTKFQKALSFLNAHWYDTASSYTNFGDYYTMYAIMKGMRIPHPSIELIGTHDWYAEYARYIVDQQNAYGGEYLVDHSWLSSYTERILATAWAVAVLTPTLVMPGPVADAGPDVDNFPPTIPVKFDASGSYHRDPTKSIVLYEWDFESDGTWDYSFGRFVYPNGKAGPYAYAGWLAGGPGMPPYQTGYYHLGQDMEANEGDNVYAIADGEIIYVSVSDWGEGNFGLLIKHKLNTGEEFLALYGHVRPNSGDLRRTISGPVDPPIPVMAGEAFATIGPYDSIPHLHFGIHPGVGVPPSPWGRMPLSQWPNTNGFVDPLDWITTRAPLKSVPLYVEHPYPAYKNPDGSIDWDKTAKDYTATLRVTDNSDPPLRDTDTCVVHITPPPWKPVADPDGPYEGYVGAPIQLDGSKSYDPESKMYPPDHPWYETIAKYEWDLDNDGKFDDSTEIKPSWTWDSKGTYSVGLKVTDFLPSGPGGSIGPLDFDIKYTTVVIAAVPVNPWGDDDGDGVLNFLESIALSPYNIQSLGYYSDIGFSIGAYDAKVGGGYGGFVDPFNTYDEITVWANAHVTTTERPFWTAEVGNIVGILFLEISKDILTTSLSLVPQTYGLLGALATFAPECADEIVRFALIVNTPNSADISTLLGITGVAPASFVSSFLDIWFLDDQPTLPDGFKFTRIPELTLENFVDAIGSTVFGLLLGKIAGMLKGVADIAKNVPKLIKQFFVDVIWANLYEKFIRPGVEFIDIHGRRFYNYIATRIHSAFRDIDLQLYVDGNLVLGGTILESEYGFYSGDTISSEYMLINATDLVNHRIILVINGTEAEMFGEEYNVSIRVMQSGSLLNEQSFTGTIDPGQIFVSSIDVSTGPQGELIATLSPPILIITIDSWITDSAFCDITEFRAVFTPDRKTGYYKLTATNPGQFYQNILVNNNGPIPLNITITYDIDPNFTMKGAMPIHVYADLSRTMDITSTCTFQDNKITAYNVPPAGIVYVTIHLDYALKGTLWTKSQVEAWYSEHTFNATAETDITSIKSSVTITDPPPTMSPYLIFLITILPSTIMGAGLLILLKYAPLSNRRRKEN